MNENTFLKGHMKNTLWVIITLSLLIGASAVAGTYYWMEKQSATETEILTEEPDGESKSKTYPLYLTTMTHMEGEFKDDELQKLFELHVEQLEYGMDLAEEYGAILTIETEKPFARANTVWNRNFMKEIWTRGHGVGTHCDIGFGKTAPKTFEDFVNALKENKALVDALVGEENNKGCSGAGGQLDWVLAALEAGFNYIDGVVGMHYLSMPLENRPEGWTDEYIHSTAYHENAPVDLEDRIHPIRMANATDFEEDEEGELVLLAGSLGRLDRMAEEAAGEECKTECVFNEADVDIAIKKIREAAALHDTSSVGKVDVYLPANNFDPENETVLRYFFSEAAKLAEEGMVEWASQLQVYEATQTTETSTASTSSTAQEEILSVEPVTEDDAIYTMFSMNVHDWVFPKESIETINHVIDIHEKYDVPVDIYVDDPVFQIYVDQAPELIERLKTSDVVTVCYHIRPPYPYYPDFDWLGFDQMSEDEIYATLLDYEEHELDLETAEPTDEPGGYQYVKDTIGYAPPIVGVTGGKSTGAMLSKVYAEKGTLFAVVHGREIELGQEQYGLAIRPEHVELKLYEAVRTTTDGGQVVEASLLEMPSAQEVEGPRFLGIKYHENNFYSLGTTFNYAFWADPEAKEGMLYPPYDLSLTEQAALRSKAEQAEHWELYESAVAYVAEHVDELSPIGAKELALMLEN
jgi:hypothetical protein